ncbi:MAG: UDP-N-acetylmuramoyl-tripeptide--D-alanyl-D-alanine ligase [Candidatus Latescibacterota bacterium]|nr:MAG: UDP-N-acetylmuramoyl-tripeptide--D-alanyl-D-alanine ligase [Candidatus Latescibacterota bacterium]
MTGKTLAWAKEALAVKGQLVQSELAGRDDDSWLGATIDTRSVCARRIFFALEGERTDGHRFVEDAAAKGCCAVVVDRSSVLDEVKGLGKPFFLVRNVLEALQTLAKDYRDTLDIRVVAVTGSMGKTTTKEYIRSILKRKYRVHSNPGNFNNHIGVPLTLLETDHDNEYLICEVAANHTGEIEFLSRLLRPDVGVITNIGDAHIGYFGSREKIAEAKAELFVGIDAQGYAVLPADDTFLGLLNERARCRVVTFGHGETSTYGISSVAEEGDRIVFEMNGEPMAIKSIGLYNVLNAGAAYAVGELCGVELDRIREALLDTEPIPGRAKVYRGRGVVLIDDSYNANPTSMRAALELLSRLSGRKIAVLGDMAELGAFSDTAHRDLGVHLARVAVDVVYWYGDNGDLVEEGFSSEGADKTFQCFRRLNELLDKLGSEVKTDDVVLVKASRACQLDRVVDGLLGTVLKEKN